MCVCLLIKEKCEDILHLVIYGVEEIELGKPDYCLDLTEREEILKDDPGFFYTTVWMLVLAEIGSLRAVLNLLSL